MDELGRIASLRQANMILWQQVADTAQVPIRSDKVEMLSLAIQAGVDRGVLLQIADNDVQIGLALERLARS